MVSVWAKARVTRPENPRKKQLILVEIAVDELSFHMARWGWIRVCVLESSGWIGLMMVMMLMLMLMMMFLLFDSFIFRDMKNRSHWGGCISCLMKLECILSVKQVTKRQQPPWDRWDSNPGTCFLKCTQNLSTNDATCKIISHSWKETRMK